MFFLENGPYGTETKMHCVCQEILCWQTINLTSHVAFSIHKLSETTTVSQVCRSHYWMITFCPYAMHPFWTKDYLNDCAGLVLTHQSYHKLAFSYWYIRHGDAFHIVRVLYSYCCTHSVVTLSLVIKINRHFGRRLRWSFSPFNGETSARRWD